jgi:hypothetical protein
MKLKSLFVLLFSLTPLAAFTGPLQKGPLRSIPHVELELRGEDYVHILEARQRGGWRSLNDPDEQKLKPVLDLGKRNLDFLKYLNSKRDPAHQISLTSAATEPASPIESPKFYNVAIAYQAYVDLLKALPAPLAQVLTGTGSFPDQLPIPEADYITWGLRTDRVYQTAARWLTLKPYLPQYAAARQDDVRGFYFLNQDPERATKLSHWQQLDAKTQAQYSVWLVEVCNNSAELQACRRQLDSLIKANKDLNEFYDRYAAYSKTHYDSYFTLAWPRKDITFSKAHPEVLRIPFIDPGNPRILGYLKDNIEDEWRWTGWNLRLDFGQGNQATTSHIRWATGVTPHVEPPNTIVMDENQPISEYESQWTIRHEFGHILGFPDCYVEFYDVDQAVMISYQLDITNLMCSRRGHLKQTHVDELKRVYLH